MISVAKLLRSDAALLAACISIMPGTEEYLNRRHAIADRVKKLWPEILEKVQPEVGSFDENERREIPFDEFDKRALGEGFRAVLKMPTSNGNDFLQCQLLADACKIGKWFRDVVSKKQIPAFDGQSDDEEQLGDVEQEKGAE